MAFTCGVLANACVSYEFPEESMRRETWIKDMSIYRILTKTPIILIKGNFKELGLARGRIRAELEFEQRSGLPYNDFLACAPVV